MVYAEEVEEVDHFVPDVGAKLGGGRPREVSSEYSGVVYEVRRHLRSQAVLVDSVLHVVQGVHREIDRRNPRRSLVEHVNPSYYQRPADSDSIDCAELGQN